MKAFAALYAALDASTKTQHKRAAIVDFLRHTPQDEASYGLAVLCGYRPRRSISGSRLRALAARACGLPSWLIDESYHHVGDLAETLALLLPPAEAAQSRPLSYWLEEGLPELARLNAAEQDQRIEQIWAELPNSERLVFHKLLTGGLRVGVARQSVVHALAEFFDEDAGAIAARLMGRIRPHPEWLQELSQPGRADVLAPYPFLLAHPLDGEPQSLGPTDDFLAEWKWDGIRAQLVHRSETGLWSRGEELIDGAFPDLCEPAKSLPIGTVLDGEVVAWQNQRVAPFSQLQRRLNRKRPSPGLLSEVPARYVVYDLLEEAGQDLREQPLQHRRQRLQALLEAHNGPWHLSPALAAADWAQWTHIRAQARDEGAEGLMLKRLDSAYSGGRPRGLWWKWKLDPYTVDCVLLYAQAGHGRRSGLHTDYTLAVWKGDELVPVTKAYSGLSDKEFLALDRWIRAHTRERFGPVRSVEPAQVLEIAFEGIQSSKRHKSGLALRFPRIARWRQDKTAADADHLHQLQALLDGAPA